MDGRRLFFEEKGIYNGVFVMRDRETGTLWSHYTGEGLSGPLKGRRLEWVKVDRGTVAELRVEGATTLARAQLRWRDKPVKQGPQRAQKTTLNPEFEKTLNSALERLPPHTHGLGVAAGTEQRFYTLDRLYEGSVIQDRLGGVDVVVMIHDGSSTAAAYSRCVDDTVLQLSATEWQGEAALKDQEGTTWAATGAAVDGPRKGAQLTSLRALITDWYGWVAFNPSTTLYALEAPP